MNNDFEFKLYTELAEQGFEDYPKFRGVISAINFPECTISLTNKRHKEYLYWPFERLYNFSIITYFETLFPDMFVTAAPSENLFLIGYENGQDVMVGELGLWLVPFGQITHKLHEDGNYIQLKLKYELLDWML